jgi:hypothetical protein
MSKFKVHAEKLLKDYKHNNYTSSRGSVHGNRKVAASFYYL